MAGLLTYSRIRTPSRKKSVAKVLFDTFPLSPSLQGENEVEITAAGTVPDLHRIPFYRNFEKNPIPKSIAKIQSFFIKNDLV